MRFAGSKRAQIICSECPQESPDFRVYLYKVEEGDYWDGREPEGWTLDEEAALGEDGIIIGSCPNHPAR